MARAKQGVCQKAGCSSLSVRGQSYCEKHLETIKQEKQHRTRQYDESRGSASARGYGVRWNKRRAVFLRKHPLCVECLKHSRYAASNTVDHIIPHKGDEKLFWDEKNWQALCSSCHSTKTAREDGGFGNSMKG